MYIVYGTAAGYCPTEGEHAAIFDAAVDCIFAEAAGNHHNSSPIQLTPVLISIQHQFVNSWALNCDGQGRRRRGVTTTRGRVPSSRSCRSATPSPPL